MIEVVNPEVEEVKVVNVEDIEKELAVMCLGKPIEEPLK